MASEIKGEIKLIKAPRDLAPQPDAGLKVTTQVDFQDRGVAGA
jgi:hypothetical protein